MVEGIICIILLVLTIWMELCKRVNTDGLVIKIALGLIAIGCLISLYGISNYLVHSGAIFVISRQLILGKGKF